MRGMHKIGASPPAAPGPGLPAPVLHGPGAREHRVDCSPVRPRRRSCAFGMGCVPGRGDRRRPGPVRPLSGQPPRFQGPFRPGVPWRGRRLSSGWRVTGSARSSADLARLLELARLTDTLVIDAARDLRPRRHQRPPHFGGEEPECPRPSSTSWPAGCKGPTRLQRNGASCA